MAPSELSALVIIDYQNIHLTGRDTFHRGGSAGDVIIDPVLFAQVGIEQRNRRQRPGFAPARLERIQLFRGLPSSNHDPVLNRAALRQMHHWGRWPALDIVYRPLSYRGGRASEKGIDVLCALALVEGVQRFDVVVLASHDTDLEPALDHGLFRGRVETLGWRGAKRIRPTNGRGCWDTRLDHEDFQRVLDPHRHEYFA